MTYVAVDIGASSGRLVLGEVENDKLKTKIVHRFANGITEKNGVCYWDIDHLLTEILKGLEVVKSLGHNSCTVGIDTWAVDYVLLDEQGNRLQEVIAYRDQRTQHTIEKVTKQLSKEKLYEKTGIQFLNFNTIYQLFEEDKEILSKTKQILMVPDYLGYCLTGNAVMEETNASTTQLLNIHNRTFDEELLNLLSIKREQFPPLCEPGVMLGKLKKADFPAYDLPDCNVITVASHDTASAVLGTPGSGDNWAFLSSGTWSLIGMEIVKPVVNRLAYQNNYTNEWGAFKTVRFLKNIIGMWLIQEVRRLLPKDYNFSQFVDEAKKVARFQQFINFNDDRFLNPNNMIAEIQHYCQTTNQVVPETPGELASCIYSNLAIIYTIALNDLEGITGVKIDRLHVVGGGAHNELLNQLTADVSGRVVYAGPTEATAIGNLAMQMIAAKDIDGLESAREMIRNSFEMKEYRPQKVNGLEIIQQFKEVVC